MSALPETPLQRVEDAPRALFLKREDLLPYGGGNKVPRFLFARARRPETRRVAAFSDYGSHSFAALAAMKRDPALGIERLELFERPARPDPYRRALAERYAATPDVHVRRGSTAGLLVRWLWHRATVRGVQRMGIGGTVRRSGACYRPAVAACARQLGEAGVDEPVVHVLALASGDTARAVHAALGPAGRQRDEVAAVVTGPWVGHVGLRLRRAPGLHLVRGPALDWDGYVAAARACHARTGVWLDPAHTLPAWEAVARLPSKLAGRAVVFWVTCPRIEHPPEA